MAPMGLIGEEALLTDPDGSCAGCVARHSGWPRTQLPRGAAPGDFAVKVMWLGKQVTKYFPTAEIVENGTGVILVSDPTAGRPGASGQFLPGPELKHRPTPGAGARTRIGSRWDGAVRRALFPWRRPTRAS